MSSNEVKRNPYEGVGKAAWEKRQLILEDYPGNLYKEAYGDHETVSIFACLPNTNTEPAE